MPTTKPANPAANDAAARQQTEEDLATQETVRVLLPRDPEDPRNAPVKVRINGVQYEVPRGVSAEVPASVAETLANARMI